MVIFDAKKANGNFDYFCNFCYVLSHLIRIKQWSCYNWDYAQGPSLSILDFELQSRMKINCLLTVKALGVKQLIFMLDLGPTHTQFVCLFVIRVKMCGNFEEKQSVISENALLLSAISAIFGHLSRQTEYRPCAAQFGSKVREPGEAGYTGYSAGRTSRVLPAGGG